MKASNAGWDSGALAAVFAEAGAFAWPANSADAAVLATPEADSGSAQVKGLNNATGITLAEIYALDDSRGDLARLVNLSARTVVAPSDFFTAGFVIVGNTPKKVLLRAVGPSLSLFGVPGVLAAPQLTLFDAAGRSLGRNAGWAGDAALASTFAQAGAFALLAGSADAALVMTLGQGSYSAQVTGGGGAVLVEIYEVP